MTKGVEAQAWTFSFVSDPLVYLKFSSYFYFSRLIGIRNLAVLREADVGAVLLKSWDPSGKFIDRKVGKSELLPCILGWRNDLMENLKEQSENTSIQIHQSSNLELHLSREGTILIMHFGI